MTKSKIFLYFLISFLTGVLAASVLVLPYENKDILRFVSGFSAILGLVLIILFWRQGNKFLLGFFVLTFAFGVFWYQSDIDKINKEKIMESVGKRKIQGVILSEPEFKNDKAKYVLKSDDLPEKILIQAIRYPEYEYGDEISVNGYIKEPENFTDDFDYKSYLAKSSIFLIVINPDIELVAKNKGNFILTQLYRFKNNLEKGFKENLPEPQSSLLSGIILGARSAMPDDLSENLKKTGTAHIVALSGFNISIIAWFVMGALSFFMISRNISFWLSIFIIVVFVLMTGASSSVVRAAVMGILILIARQKGRMYMATNALVVAGAVMVFAEPKILKFDIGFQLSFLATLGLILLYPKLEEKMGKIPNGLGAKEAFIATISAQIFVLPLILYYFGNFSLISPLVNVLILPAVPFIMLFGFLGGFIGLVSPFIAKIFIWPAWIFLSYVIETINFFAGFQV